MDLNVIIPYRPVTHVTVQETIAAIGLPLFVLRPLRDSKGPIEYLSLSLMDPINTSTLSLIHAHTPHLTSLELAAPRPRSTTSELAWGDSFKLFKGLTLVRYESSLDIHGVPHPVPHHEQEALVHGWFEASPILRTIEFLTEVFGEDDGESVHSASSDPPFIMQTVDVWKLENGKWKYSQEERMNKGW